MFIEAISRLLESLLQRKMKTEQQHKGSLQKPRKLLRSLLSLLLFCSFCTEEGNLEILYSAIKKQKTKKIIHPYQKLCCIWILKMYCAYTMIFNTKAFIFVVKLQCAIIFVKYQVPSIFYF